MRSAFLAWRPLGRGHQAEIDVHRLVGVGIGAAGDVTEQGADRGLGRRGGQRFARELGGGEAGGDQADGGAFDIALAAGDLAGEADVAASISAAAHGRAARGELMKLLRWIPPSRANSACSRPGMVRKIRTWSPCFSLVWKPTMFHKVPSALSWRSWTTA